MKRLKIFTAPIILLFIYLLALAFIGNMLPADARIPIHWNAAGQIDGYASRSTALIFAFVLVPAMFLLLYLLPYYSPKYKQQAARFDHVLPYLTFMLVLFLALLNLYGLCYPLGADSLPFNPVLIIIGLMMLFLGNLLPKLPRNFFVGIRTPWTISDEDNWYKTHRVGGRCFLFAGLMLILKGFLSISPAAQNISTWLALALLLYPLLYSFILFKKS